MADQAAIELLDKLLSKVELTQRRGRAARVKRITEARTLYDAGEIDFHVINPKARLPQEEIEDVRRQFERRIKSRFLMHVVERHERELQAAGMDDYGIACMKQGLHPYNVNGDEYMVSIDHIRDIWTFPQNARHDGDIYLANTLSNLVLIPRGLDRIKNSLLHLQLNYHPTLGVLPPYGPAVIITPKGYVPEPPNPEEAQRSLILFPKGTKLKTKFTPDRDLITLINSHLRYLEERIHTNGLPMALEKIRPRLEILESLWSAALKRFPVLSDPQQQGTDEQRVMGRRYQVIVEKYEKTSGILRMLRPGDPKPISSERNQDPK